MERNALKAVPEKRPGKAQYVGAFLVFYFPLFPFHFSLFFLSTDLRFSFLVFFFPLYPLHYSSVKSERGFGGCAKGMKRVGKNHPARRTGGRPRMRRRSLETTALGPQSQRTDSFAYTYQLHCKCSPSALRTSRGMPLETVETQH